MRRLLTALLVLAVALPCLAGWIFDGAPSEWEGIPEELQADEYVFPVFILELGSNWTDFELKASTNNFSSLVYYVMSSGSTSHAGDPEVWTYFTDDYLGDVRKWNRAIAESWIGGQLADPMNSEVEYVYVLPSHSCTVDWRTWMSRHNSKLVWSYVRFDGVGFEMNATGSKARWNPVQPVAWVRARIAP
jgi:hypothetical protein